MVVKPRGAPLFIAAAPTLQRQLVSAPPKDVTRRSSLSHLCFGHFFSQLFRTFFSIAISSHSFHPNQQDLLYRFIFVSFSFSRVFCSFFCFFRHQPGVRQPVPFISPHQNSYPTPPCLLYNTVVFV